MDAIRSNQFFFLRETSISLCPQKLHMCFFLLTCPPKATYIATPLKFRIDNLYICGNKPNKSLNGGTSRRFSRNLPFQDFLPLYMNLYCNLIVDNNSMIKLKWRNSKLNNFTNLNFKHKQVMVYHNNIKDIESPAVVCILDTIQDFFCASWA